MPAIGEGKVFAGQREDPFYASLGRIFDTVNLTGAGLGNTTSNIVIKGNRFGQLYFPKSGQFGPVAYFASAGKGNVWSGNIWDTTGQAIASP